MDKEDRDQIKKKIHEASEKSENARKEKQTEAKKTAEKLVSTMTANLRGCDYAEHKKIMDVSTGAGTVLFENGRVLVIPMRDETGELMGAQMIHPDGRKLFITGQQTSGCFHVMGEPDGTIILAEGFATAASVRQATGHAAVVCFNCNNLGIVAGIMRRKYPAAAIIIAGDDDKWTDGNPGRTKAEETAAKVGAAAIFPVFKNPEKGKTDFNDLHCAEGLDTVREQLTKNDVQPEPTGFIPLGFDEGVHYFYNKKSRSIVKISAFSDRCMFELMPLTHWEAIYPSKRGIDWQQAKSDLIESSQAVGVFDSSRIRGVGPWLDRGRIVVNTGKCLIVDGVKKQTLDSRRVYIQTQNKISIDHEPLTTSETAHLRNACDEMKWRDKNSSIFLAGWIAVSRIAGALPIRPHIWLTAGSGAGKSTVIERIVRPALGGESIRVQGGTTEAGIRQKAKADSIPLVFDEFETSNKQHVLNNMSAIIELLRQAWSQSSGWIVKGSSGGTVNHYSVNYSAFVVGIRTNTMDDADKSRFTIIELDKHDSNQKNWDKIETYLDHITDDYGKRLTARMIKMIPVVIESQKIFSKHIAKGTTQRFGQQYGTLLAGWYALLSDYPVSEHVAAETVAGLKFHNIEEPTVTDEEDCLTHLLTTKISIQVPKIDAEGYKVKDETKRADMSIEGIIESGNDDYISALTNYGILVDSTFIHIHKNHSSLRKYVFSGTKWPNWSNSLKRLPGAVCKSNHKKRFGGGNPQACVSIPLDIVVVKDTPVPE
jgi:putative DNA primase/helicase